MLEDRTSFLSKNFSGETNQRTAYGIEKLEFRLEKQPSENNKSEEAAHINLELSLACGGFSVASPPQNGNSKIVGHQYNKNDGLDLGLGTLLVPSIIPPPQPVDTSSLIDAIGRDISISCLLRCPRAAYGSIASLNRSFRELIKSEEIYKLRHDNKVIEHWVYYSCHCSKWEAFDPSTKKWMQLPELEADLEFQLSDRESMAVGTQLLVLGRSLNGHVTHKYSLLTNSWSVGQTMKTPRNLFASANLGQTAIFAGGVNAKRKIMDTVELYDSRSGNWETLPNLIKPRKLCAGAYMDGKFYVIGGVGIRMQLWTCGEEYDFETKKWTEIPNMSPMVARRGNSAPPLLAVVGNELYFADSADMTLKKYDKQKKEWKVIGMLPERAQSINGWGMAFKGCGDRVIVIGGPQRDETKVVEIYSWIPSKGPPEWSVIGQRRLDSFVYNCAVMGV